MNINGLGRGLCALCFAPAFACAPPSRSYEEELRRVESTLSALPSEDAPASTPSFDGSLASYLSYAYANSPALRARFEAWRAMTHRSAQERRLPEPTVTYAAFVRSVETRVGPQRHRIGASQWFPWPSKLGAGRDAADLEARAAQRRFDAQALEIGAEVAAAYWELWRLQRRAEVLGEEATILAGLSEQVRVRVEVNVAEMADLAQIDLSLSRARDRVEGIEQTIAVAEARLVRVLGAPVETPTPVRADAPVVEELAEPMASLYADAGMHPDVESFAIMSDAAHDRVREARADRAPSFGVGVDWILTGESSLTPAPADSGKDAVALSLSMKVPLWTRAYRAAESEARARGASMRAQALHARNGAVAEVRAQAARIRDDIRRVHVYDTTLIPQAEGAFDSVLAGYAAGRSTVGELLLAEKALLELRDERFSAQADYAVHLAQLERAVGRPVQTGATEGGDDE